MPSLPFSEMLTNGNAKGRRSSGQSTRWSTKVSSFWWSLSAANIAFQENFTGRYVIIEINYNFIALANLFCCLLLSFTYTENAIVSALICCEPETLSVNDSACKERWSVYSKSPTDKTICILGDLVDRELVNTIVWAKQIPGFSDLILNDQMRLLQNSWAEVLSLSLAYRYV